METTGQTSTELTVRIAAAADRMYSAECALHAARQAAVDSWVSAAYDRLHDAIEDYHAAQAARGLSAAA